MRLEKGTKLNYRHHVSRKAVTETELRTWEAHGKIFVQIVPLCIMEFVPEEFDAFAGALDALQSKRRAQAAKGDKG